MGTQQFEHKKKRNKKDRLRYAYYDSFGTPIEAFNYESRVKTDGGIMEAFDCLVNQLIKLS